MEDGFITKQKEFRLTAYGPGTLRELWSISWPLMLASFSGTFMTFIDRAVLARYQSEAFDACSAAQPWFWTFEGFFMAFIVCTEILIGRFNGARQYKKIGPAVWQMVLISFSSFIILIPVALNAHYLLSESVERLALPYLQLILLTLPFEMAAFGAIGAFFVGRGDTKKIPIVLITVNLINGVGDIWLVFGGFGLPSMGIIGAALATSLSHICSFVIFLALFLKKKYREKYAIHTFHWSWDFLKQCIHIGMPNAISLGSIMMGWSICYQFFSLELTPLMYKAYCIAFTIYNFMFFVMDGMGKGVGTLCSNFLGAQIPLMLEKVLKQALRLTLIFSLFFIVLLLFSNPVVRFLAPASFFQNSLFCHQVDLFLYWYGGLFILETLCFCAQYFLFSLMKAKITLFFNVSFFWGIQLIPTYFFIKWLHWNPIIYLQLSCINHLLLLIIFFLWYRKKTWLTEWEKKTIKA